MEIMYMRRVKKGILLDIVVHACNFSAQDDWKFKVSLDYIESFR
jgi:hypothetical protein